MKIGDVRKAVAIGGGSGIKSTLKALLSLGFETSAVVAMADNGGSTGRLRQSIGIVPPGDIRNCLVTMASEDNAVLAEAFQHRFPNESEDGVRHALGNLILTALTEVTGSFTEAIVYAEQMLETRGHVYPSTLEDVHLFGVSRDGEQLAGQVEVCNSTTAVDRVWLQPEDAAAYTPAAGALKKADLIVLGPGSLFTSVVPNLLVKGIAEAICESNALVVLACNVANQQGETRDLSAYDYVVALDNYGLAGRLDVALVNAEPSLAPADGVVQPISATEEDIARIEEMGVTTLVADLVNPDDPAHHSSKKFAHALEEVCRTCHSRQK